MIMNYLQMLTLVVAKEPHPNGFEILRAHPFLGNVRELKNILKRAVVLSLEEVLDEFIKNDIEGRLDSNIEKIKENKSDKDKSGPSDERISILDALDISDWNKSKAATLLGISRRTIYRKIDRLKITKQFKRT